MAKPKSLTLAVLTEIRDEIRSTRVELSARIDATNQRLDAVNERLDGTNERLGAVEQGLLELAEQQRFVVRHLRGSSARDRRVDAELDNLRLRLDALESRRDPR
jgi:chromosome segregation ATPase